MGRSLSFSAGSSRSYGSCPHFWPERILLPWPKFLVANALGGVLWATVVSVLAYWMGEGLRHLHGPLSVLLLVAGAAGAAAAVVYFKRNEERLIAEAERAFPGSLAGFQTSGS